MKILTLLFGMFLFVMHTHADANINDDKEQAQHYLHSYGIAYCLSHSNIYQEEAQIVIGGYFQLGDHGQDAYRKVKEFIDEQLKHGAGGYQGSKLPAFLMNCLSISQTNQYQALIEQLRILPNEEDFLEED